MIPPRESKSLSPLRFVFKHPLAMESETNWFLLLGALDLLGTLVLMRTGAARETNPLAQFILTGGGLQGLIYYKCALLAVVAIAAQVIVLKHPRVARLVLGVGIAAQLLVVVISLRLIVQAFL